MKFILRSLTLVLLASSLTSCIAVAAGAAGGWYVGKNYDIDIHKKSTAHAKKRHPKRDSEDDFAAK